MIRRPPRSTRTDTLFPYTTLVRSLHALAAVVWIGGMFFAYMAMRPAVGPLAPADRLSLWQRTFAPFFLWVWVSNAVLALPGYWLVFGDLRGFRWAGAHIPVIQHHGAPAESRVGEMWCCLVTIS